MEIMTARRRFGMSLADVAARGHLAEKAVRLGVKLPAIPKRRTANADAAVAARIYRNQWIVDCPDCKNAEYVSPEDPHFMCSDCFNGAVGGAWRPVEFPADRAAIEAVIKARPLLANRNWSPGETVQQLHAENLAHGLPLEVR